MLIAQLTDLHIGTGDDIGAEDNYQRLLMVFERLARLKRQPDLYIATGDLTETGSVPAYRLLKRMIDRAELDVLPCMGNHDISANFKRVFGRMHFHDGFCQYQRDFAPFRLIVTDTHEEGLHGGAFCEARAEWLDEALASANGKPVLLALHHPPILTGIDWMTPRSAEEPWIVRLRSIVSRYPNVKKIISGHVHRPMARPFAGSSLIVASAVAAEVDLELAPVSLNHADNRPLIVAEPPGFALHWWDGQEFLTHFGIGGDYESYLDYHERFREVMRDVFHVPED